MNFDFYSKFIKTIDMYPKEADLACYTLGFLGEIDEFISATASFEAKENITKEAGDVFWYGFRIIDRIGKNPNDLIFKTFQIESLVIYPKISELVKKTYRDGKDNSNEIFNCVNAGLSYVLSRCEEYNIFIDEILEKNYMKLQSRKERGVLQGSGDAR